MKINVLILTLKLLPETKPFLPSWMHDQLHSHEKCCATVWFMLLIRHFCDMVDPNSKYVGKRNYMT